MVVGVQSANVVLLERVDDTNVRDTIAVRLAGADGPRRRLPGFTAECGATQAIAATLSATTSAPVDTDGDTLADTPGGVGASVTLDLAAASTPFDSAGRVVGRLTSLDGPVIGDLGRALIESGWLVPNEDEIYPDSYLPAVDLATAERRGLWGACGGEPHRGFGVRDDTEELDPCDTEWALQAFEESAAGRRLRRWLRFGDSEPVNEVSPPFEVTKTICADLTGDGELEMVVWLTCCTASSPAPWAIFTRRGLTWKLVDSRVGDTIWKLDLIDGGLRMIGPEYSRNDSHCCPTRLRERRVAYRDGKWRHRDIVYRTP